MFIASDDTIRTNENINIVESAKNLAFYRGKLSPIPFDDFDSALPSFKRNVIYAL
jgi:hypothetical protein